MHNCCKSVLRQERSYCLTKLAEQWLILIAKPMAVLLEVVPAVVLIRTMEVPTEGMEIAQPEDMETACTSQNINARSRTKPNAIQCHVLSQLSTVRTEKRKSARNLLKGSCS